MFKKKNAPEKTEREKYLQKERINQTITDAFKKYKTLIIVVSVAVVVCFSAWFYAATHPEFMSGFKPATETPRTTQQIEAESDELNQIPDNTEYEPIIYLGRIFQENNYAEEEIAEIFKKDKQEILGILKSLGYLSITDRYNSELGVAEAVYKNETSNHEITYRVTKDNKELFSEKTFPIKNEADIKAYISHICDVFDCGYAEINILDLYSFVKKTPIPEDLPYLNLFGTSTIYSKVSRQIDYTITKRIVDGEEWIDVLIKEM